MKHLAELNIGRLVAPRDDPRVAEFMTNLDRINALGSRMPGFVWMMEGSGAPETGNTASAIGGNALLIPNMTVWETVKDLETFVWGTVHRQFYERRAEWFEVLGEMHFVMWWITPGHKPSLDEGLSRLQHRADHGNTDEAFGWDYLGDAKMWRTHGCAPVAAE